MNTSLLYRITPPPMTRIINIILNDDEGNDKHEFDVAAV
jgi:hypothetical protein